jgi:hypothetical protein
VKRRFTDALCSRGSNRNRKKRYLHCSVNFDHWKSLIRILISKSYTTFMLLYEFFSSVVTVGIEVLKPAVMKGSIFWDVTTRSQLKVNLRSGGTWRLHLQSLFCLALAFTQVSCCAYSSILKTEATCSSETLVHFQRTTRCYIPEDRTLLSCEWLLMKSWLQSGRLLLSSYSVIIICMKS